MGPKRKVGGDIAGPSQTPAAGTAAMIAPGGDSSGDASVLRGAPGIHTAAPPNPRGSQPNRGRGRSSCNTGRAADASGTISVTNPDTRSAAAAVVQCPNDQDYLVKVAQNQALYQHPEDLAGNPTQQACFVEDPHYEDFYEHPEDFDGNLTQQAFFVVPQQPQQPTRPAAAMEAPSHAPQQPQQPALPAGLIQPYVPQHSLSRPPLRPGITAQPRMHASSSPFTGFARPPVIPGQPARPGQPQMQQLGPPEDFIQSFRVLSANGIAMMQSLIQERNRWAAEAQAHNRLFQERTDVAMKLAMDLNALAKQLIQERAARAEGLKADEARFRKELIREKEHLASELRKENAQLSDKLRTEKARLSDELRTEKARLSDELESERGKAETERRTVAALQSKLRLVRGAQARALGLTANVGEPAAAPTDSGSARTGQADTDCECCWACLVVPATVKISPCGHRCLCGPCFNAAFMLLVMEDDDLWCPICDAPTSGQE